MIDADDALALARQWDEGWNGEDVARIMAPFADDVVFTSPFVARTSVRYGFFATGGGLALAGLILKLETITNERMKKDVAAVLAVSAALLITISTGGDFQRKWQANRIAAAELERTGYEFLEKDEAASRSYLAPVGQILHRRHMAIVGGTEQEKSPTDAAKGAPSGK